MASLPSRLRKVETNGKSLDIYLIDEVPNYEAEDYCLSDDSDKQKFIDDTEKDIRKSFEYQEMVQYLREYMDMNKCSFFEGITNMESTKIKIHIHHSPITLFEIVSIIFLKREYYGESLDLEFVAKEATYVHYNLLVGLIPLCETVHELVHNEYLFVPNDAVMGYYNQFVQMYYPWIPTTLKEKLKKLDAYTDSYNEAENMKILQPNYIYLNLAGTYKLPKMEDVARALQFKMDNLKLNNYSTEPVPLVTFFDKNGKIIENYK